MKQSPFPAATLGDVSGALRVSLIPHPPGKTSRPAASDLCEKTSRQRRFHPPSPGLPQFPVSIAARFSPVFAIARHAADGSFSRRTSAFHSPEKIPHIFGLSPPSSSRVPSLIYSLAVGKAAFFVRASIHSLPSIFAGIGAEPIFSALRSMTAR